MRTSPLYADFALQMLFCWDCQLQIACGNTSSMQQINTYTIIAYPCYCHDCKQLIKGMYLLCLRVIHSSHIFSTFKPIDFMEHLASFHCTVIVLLCHHLKKRCAVYLHTESAPQVRVFLWPAGVLGIISRTLEVFCVLGIVTDLKTTAAEISLVGQNTVLIMPGLWV